MPWTRWLIVLLTALCGGWMVFDGARALVVGDYVTPSSGAYAGRLGPWARVLDALGVAPRATAVKLAFIVYGAALVVFALAFAARAPWATRWLLVTAALGLWYIPVGTFFNGAAILLIVLFHRAAGG
jgi:hypothetical protein